MQFSVQEGGAKIPKTLKKVIDKTLGETSLGFVPNGATIEKIEVAIRTGFNGASATIDIGNADNDDAYMDATDITEATPGAYVVYPNALMTADTEILITLGGTVGTTGDATVLLTYTV